MLLVFASIIKDVGNYSITDPHGDLQIISAFVILVSFFFFFLMFSATSSGAAWESPPHLETTLLWVVLILSLSMGRILTKPL